MADKYIDYREVVEYGRHLIGELQKLIGLSTVVDIGVLQQLVQAVVDAMEGALAVANRQQSGARAGRGGVYISSPCVPRSCVRPTPCRR